MARRTNVGELRPSQLLHTFGVGAVVDLPQLSVMVMGLEDWDVTSCRPVVEDRLLQAVRRQLGTQVERMVLPPLPPDDEPGVLAALDAAVSVGVPVASFPRYLRCPACSTLAPRTRGVFDLKIEPYRSERTRYVHTACQNQRGKVPPAALPARFLVACERGHLDEFPWVSYVHQGELGCRGRLELREYGASGEVAYVEVSCQCGKRRRMADAFGEKKLEGYRCRGRRPHLRDRQEAPCEEAVQAILLGASNSWFAVTLSLLYVPPSAGDQLAQLVEDQWVQLAKAKSRDVLEFLRDEGRLGALAKYGLDEVWQAIEARRRGGGVGEEEGDLKRPSGAYSRTRRARRRRPISG